MAQHSLTINWEDLARDELDPEEQADLAIADEARLRAYAPYTNFLVGVAVRTNDDLVVPGWNMETIVHSGTHAEENALGNIAVGSRQLGVKRVTVAGGLQDSLSEEPVTSCGDCRQKILELVRAEDDPMIIMAGVRGRVLRAAVKSLLPLAFYPAAIKR